MNNANELRKKYMDNPPLGYSKKEIERMPEAELLDMEYFLSKDLDDIFGLSISGETVKFKCKKCFVEEDIPKNVVDMMDAADGGDSNFPPRFDCEKCNGLMQPINYTGTRGITYKF